MRKILFCNNCNKYTMKELHECGNKTVLHEPAKWSPEDKYGSYRLRARREELVKRELI